MGAVYLKMVQEQDTLRQNAYKSDGRMKLYGRIVRDAKGEIHKGQLCYSTSNCVYSFTTYEVP